jgi:hypothetical protein
MSAIVSNKTTSTLRRSFVWNPDQCPDCGYALCDHVAGTRGVNDAAFHCSQCSASFAYGAILKQEGPTFVRIESGTKLTSTMNWPRGWNRLIEWYRDDEALLQAILSGRLVKTPWASYVLSGFHKGVATMTGFRAVREEWFPHSSSFVDRDHLIAFLSYVACAAATFTEVHEYGDVTSVSVMDGKAFLEFVAHNAGFRPGPVSRSMGKPCSPKDLKPLIDNMKALEPEWRKAIDKHNKLVFYVD